MAITSSDVKTRYPELAAIDNNVLNALISDTTAMFNLTRWAGFYTAGHCALVAHYAALGSGQASGLKQVSGQKSSESGDSLSVSYATWQPGSFSEAFFASTAYGQFYWMLVKTIGKGASCVCGA